MRARLTRSLPALAVTGVLAITVTAHADAKTHPNPTERHVFLCYSPKYSDDVVTFRVSQQVTALDRAVRVFATAAALAFVAAIVPLRAFR